MNMSSDYQPEFESLKDLLIEMAQERSLDNLLNLIVHRFSQRPHIDSARMWLVRPGDRCETCAMESKCFNRNNCLHLVAVGETSEANSGADGVQVDDTASRLPFGQEVIGRIAATGEPFEIRNLAESSKQFDQPSWFFGSKTMGFSGEPLVYRGEVMGVLAIAVRIEIPVTAHGEVSRGWLRLVADHAASAIVNARAFDKIERLQEKLAQENAYLQEAVLEAHQFNRIVGTSRPVEKLLQQIDVVASTDVSVLITGETGTGKELVAHEIHAQSLRGDRPLIKVNCASIPMGLWESEFFGHVKGSFTGAVKDRTGRFELADEGTLFLDEIGEIPLELQSRLLRVLQEGQFERVGDEITRQVNVRIIAASNRDLEREVAEGRFREDLFYRLNVFPISVPPLRERKTDIPLLATHFIRLGMGKLNRADCRLSDESEKGLIGYHWPGNVRELRNVIERSMITSQSPVLEIDIGVNSRLDAGGIHEKTHEAAIELPVVTMREITRLAEKNIRAALEQTRGQIYGPRGAAALLEIKPTTLASRIRKMKLQEDRPPK
jgi:transcriptional regulator with GAF, ATPase, and Fis domain